MLVTLKTGESVDIPPTSLPIEVPECGCCGHHHLLPLRGLLGEDHRDDCRFDDNRYTPFELDDLFGEDGWIDAPAGEDEDE